MQNSGASPAARVSAACAILDRGYGKPAQTVNQELREKRSVLDWTTEELIAFLNNSTGRGLETREDGDEPEKD